MRRTFNTHASIRKRVSTLAKMTNKHLVTGVPVFIPKPEKALKFTDIQDWDSFLNYLEKQGVRLKVSDEVMALDNYNGRKSMRFGELKKLTMSESGYTHSVNLEEAFSCCGKAYLHDFPNYHPLIADVIFKSAELISRNQGYSSLGFCHVTPEWISHAKSMGFQEICKFKNKRSGNVLSEMVLIL